MIIRRSEHRSEPLGDRASDTGGGVCHEAVDRRCDVDQVARRLLAAHAAPMRGQRPLRVGRPGLVFDEFEYLTVEVLASRHCDRAVGAEIGLGGECGGIPLKKARPSSSGGAVDIPASVATRSDTLCTP